MHRSVILLLSLTFLAGLAAAADPIAGTWACQSMSFDAYTGRSCHLEPWLKIQPDKTYEWGQE